MRRLLVATVAVAAFVTFGPGGAPAGAGLPPRVAFDTDAGGVDIAALDGGVTWSVTNVSPYFSISDGVLAAARPTANGGSKVVGVDGVTGATLFTIQDAFFPLISGKGSRVVFLPDGHAGGAGDRDPAINSVWYRDVGAGSDHRLVQFSGSDRIPLNLAISPKGRRVAITHGNDADLLQWDVWTARTDLHLVRRLTTDGISTYPSFDPSGGKIAFTKHDPGRDCSGSVWIMRSDGSRPHRVASATCSRRLLRPVWLGPHTLVAWWWGPGGVKGLVRIALQSGTVTPIVWGAVVDFSVSRILGKVAMHYQDGRVALYDIAGGTVATVPVTPQGSRVFLSGALELAY